MEISHLEMSRALHHLLLLLSVTHFARGAGRHVCSENGCWPLTWLLGCQKCGSTSLAVLMHKKRIACYANVTGVNEGKPGFFSKETHFWDDSRVGIALDPREFVKLYPEEWSVHCDSFVEATPNNLAYVEVARAVYSAMPVQALPMVKIVIVLREPIARHLSLYNHQRAMKVDWSWSCKASLLETYEDYASCELGIWRKIYANVSTNSSSKTEDVDEEKGLDDVRYWLGDSSTWGGIYVPQIARWTAFFPRDRFLIMHFDDITGIESAEYFDIISAFLGGKNKPSHSAKKTKPIPHINALPVLKESQEGVSCTTVENFNREIYDQWNEKLYAMLEQDRELQRAPPIEPHFHSFQPFSACY